MSTLIKRNQDLFGGFLDNFFSDSPFFSPNEGKGYFTVPAVNIKNESDGFEIEVAAPGLDKEDFNIEVEDNVLRLSVNKSSEEQEKRENFTRKEFNYFNFQRSFQLPKHLVKAEEVKANYKDGILRIVLPKSKEERELIQKISVK